MAYQRRGWLTIDPKEEWEGLTKGWKQFRAFCIFHVPANPNLELFLFVGALGKCPAIIFDGCSSKTCDAERSWILWIVCVLGNSQGWFQSLRFTCKMWPRKTSLGTSLGLFKSILWAHNQHVQRIFSIGEMSKVVESKLYPYHIRIVYIYIYTYILIYICI